MRSTLRRGRSSLAALATTLLLAACAPAAGPAPAAPPAARATAPTTSAPAAAAAPTAAPASAPAAAAPNPLRVRYATQFASAGIAMYLGVDRGYFQQEGINVEFERFASNSEAIPALATDQVEAGGVSMNAAFWNAAARGIPLKVSLDQGSLRPGASFTALVIRKDLYDAGRGRSLADLRGLNLVNTPPGKATTNYCAMAYALQRAGIPDEVSMSPLPFADMPAALANGAIDGGLFGDPFLTRALKQGSGVKVMGQDEMYPNHTLNVVAFAPVLHNNRAAAKGFTRAYVRAVRDYNNAVFGRTDAADRERVYDTMSRYTRIDVDTVREAFPAGLNPNGLPNVESIRWCYNFFRAEGVVPEALPEATIDALWSLDVLEEVLGELGRVEG